VIESNTSVGGLTLRPAGMHCPAGDDAFVSSLFVCWSRSESGPPCVRGVHSSNTHCVAIYRPISTRFEVFFFGRDCAFRHATQFSHSSLGGVGIVDVHLYKNFSTRRYQQVSNFALVVQKQLGMNKLCASKVLQEVNFPKSFLGSCIQDGLWLCTYIAVFLCGVRWRHNRAPNL